MPCWLSCNIEVFRNSNSINLTSMLTWSIAGVFFSQVTSLCKTCWYSVKTMLWWCVPPPDPGNVPCGSKWEGDSPALCWGAPYSYSQDYSLKIIAVRLFDLHFWSSPRLCIGSGAQVQVMSSIRLFMDLIFYPSLSLPKNWENFL